MDVGVSAVSQTRLSRGAGSILGGEGSVRKASDVQIPMWHFAYLGQINLGN